MKRDNKKHNAGGAKAKEKKDIFQIKDYVPPNVIDQVIPQQPLKKISVNNIKLDDMRSVSHMDMWPEVEYNLYDTIKELGKKTYFVGLGSVIRAGMCVANGDFNLALYPGTKHRNCDLAAIKVIVEEAGGKVTDLFGNEQRYDQDIKGAIISNSVVHAEVIDVIKNNLE